MKINKLIFEITNKCNLRCNMCGIWKDQIEKDLDFAIFKKTLTVWKLSAISFTGGEPFLADLFSYYQYARNAFPQAWINISSNGCMVDEILAFFKKITDSRINITLSMDGLESHDKIRGIKGSKVRVLKTASLLKDLGVDMFLKYTINPLNYLEIASTVIYLTNRGYRVQVKMSDYLPIHYSRNIQKPMKWDSSHMIKISEQLSSIDVKLSNSQYGKKIFGKIKSESSNCSWQKNTCFVGLDGNIYLCRKSNPMGSLTNSEVGDLRSRVLAISELECDKECYEFDWR